jgi:hypothetical protein
MGEEVVGLEIFVHFDELQVATGLFACAAGAGLAVADHAAPVGDPIGLGERAERKNDTGGVAAGIGDEARFGDFGGVEFRKALDGFAEPIGVWRGQLVPGFEGFGVTEAKGAAEINDPDSGFHQHGSDFRRGFVRCG